MSASPSLTLADERTLTCLAAWMPQQRWYASKGRSPSLRLVASWELPASSPAVQIRTLLVADDAVMPAVLYQVPIVARADAAAGSAHSADSSAESAPDSRISASDHVIGSSGPGTILIDGAFDPAYTSALLRLVAHGGHSSSGSAAAHGVPADAAPPVDLDSASAVLTGEQSNTSIIFRSAAGGTPVICKVFRQLHPGLNPDIELQTALAETGSSYVPRAIGSIAGEWPDVTDHRRLVTGSLAFAQEFLTGVEDAWRVALLAAVAGEDFSTSAHDLGIATAEVHRSLSQLFPTRIPTADERSSTVRAWRRGLTSAIAEVPQLAPYRDSIDAVYERAAGIPWPPLQRIHGDYHLGQVIQVPGRGWVLLDFEGEPLRPLTERVEAQLALRDVAGMLRSFDYVGGSLRLDLPEHSPESITTWVLAARRAFLEGYAEATALDLSAVAPLLQALETEKAVYEAIYEHRNRPTWIAIPLQAIARVTGGSASDV